MENNVLFVGLAVDDNGFHCDIVAPSSIPRSYGNNVKTDRIDAKNSHNFIQRAYCHLLYFLSPPLLSLSHPYRSDILLSQS